MISVFTLHFNFPGCTHSLVVISGSHTWIIFIIQLWISEWLSDPLTFNMSRSAPPCADRDAVFVSSEWRACARLRSIIDVMIASQTCGLLQTGNELWSALIGGSFTHTRTHTHTSSHSISWRAYNERHNGNFSPGAEGLVMLHCCYFSIIEKLL